MNGSMAGKTLGAQAAKARACTIFLAAHLALHYAALASALFCAAALTGCVGDVAGTGTGNPPSPRGQVALSFQAVNEHTLAKAAGRAQSETRPLELLAPDSVLWRIDSIVVRVETVELDLPEKDDCESIAPVAEDGEGCDEGEFKWKGRFEVDLLSGWTRPDSLKLSVPSGLYSDLELGLAEGTNVRLYARASRAGQTWPLVLQLADDEEWDFERPGGFRVAADSLSRLEVRLQPVDWLQGVRIGDCLETGTLGRQEAGHVVVEEASSCGGAVAVLLTNLRESGELEEESDN